MHRDMITLAGLSEPVSSVTHLLAGLAMLVLAPALLRRARGEPARVAALVAYVAGTSLMFLTSGVYHALPQHHSAWSLFWHLDHGSIWIALAATFTPVMVLVGPPRFYRRLLVLAWSVAFCGATLELLALQRLPPWVSPLLYIGMAWGCCLPAVLMVRRRLGASTALPLLLAGSLATAGGFMDSLEAPHLVVGWFEAHELMHLCMVVGGVVYYRFIHQCADGRHALSRPRARAWRLAFGTAAS